MNKTDLMEKIDIHKKVKDVSLKLKKLEEINETYLKLKNKYNELEIFYDANTNKYNFYINIIHAYIYDIEYSFYWWSGPDMTKTLYLKRNIVDNEYKVTIYIRNDLEILEVFYSSSEIYIWDYYNLPNNLVSKIESLLIDKLTKNKLKITNKSQSEKVQRFIDNLIFI